MLALGYDPEEYRWCEIDRSLNLPKLRVAKKVAIDASISAAYGVRLREMVNIPSRDGE
jgi:hypothetical protein